MGLEPCTIADIKAYKPQSSSVGSGQVLHCPYPFDRARLVVREMADQLALDLVEKDLAADQVVLTVGYDIDNLRDPALCGQYGGEVKTDRYGRKIPKHAHGTANLKEYTSSTKQIVRAVTELYDRITDRKLLVRRISMAACHVLPRSEIREEERFEQMDLFTDYTALQKNGKRNRKSRNGRERCRRLCLRSRENSGKNAILKGMNLEEGATARERNSQIGGHRA